MCPPATKGRAWYPPWWALLAPEPGVKGSPPLSVKTNSAASLLRLLYSLSCLPAWEDEVTCKCVALVSKSGSLWQAKGCNVVSVSTGWGLFHYLTLLLQLLLIQAGLDFPKCSSHSVLSWKSKWETHLDRRYTRNKCVSRLNFHVKTERGEHLGKSTCDKPMIFFPGTDVNVINTDTNVVFDKKTERSFSFWCPCLAFFKNWVNTLDFLSGTKVRPVFSNTWTIHAEDSVNLWPVTTEQHESHSRRTETRSITAW